MQCPQFAGCEHTRTRRAPNAPRRAYAYANKLRSFCKRSFVRKHNAAQPFRVSIRGGARAASVIRSAPTVRDLRIQRDLPRICLCLGPSLIQAAQPFVAFSWRRGSRWIAPRRRGIPSVTVVALTRTPAQHAPSGMCGVRLLCRTNLVSTQHTLLGSSWEVETFFTVSALSFRTHGHREAAGCSAC